MAAFAPITEQIVFIRNGSPIIESHDDEPSRGSMNVKLLPGDSQLSDLQLIDAIIERIKTSQGTLSLNPPQRTITANHVVPLKYPNQEYVCFSFIRMSDHRTIQNRTVAQIALAYRDEIARGRISFDRHTLFGKSK